MRKGKAAETAAVQSGLRPQKGKSRFLARGSSTVPGLLDGEEQHEERQSGVEFGQSLKGSARIREADRRTPKRRMQNPARGVRASLPAEMQGIRNDKVIGSGLGEKGQGLEIRESVQ